jgi:hypothetical protein
LKCRASLQQSCGYTGTIQIVKAETLSIIASNNNSNDSDDDFLTLFGEFTVSEDPIPSMSWVEDELAAMEMGNLD